MSDTTHSEESSPAAPVATTGETDVAPDAEITQDLTAPTDGAAVDPIAIAENVDAVVADADPVVTTHDVQIDDDTENAVEADPIEDAPPADADVAESSDDTTPADTVVDTDTDTDTAEEASDGDDESDEDGPVRFADLGLSDDLLASLTSLGYVNPTPIQAESIPPLLDGFDLLGQAATGTGKTAAFALPMLDRVAGAKRSKLPFGLVLVPTRELANQVAEAMKEYGSQSKVRMAALFGGTNIGPQFSLLNAGVDIVIGTPGRVLDHLKRGSLDLSNCGMVVLDEADEMLDMGFAEDLEAILDAAPPERQTVLFSATMPNRIDSIATRQLSDPVRISIQRANDTEGTMPKVTQRAYLTHRTHRASALGRILDMESPEAAIVFCRTRGDVDELTDVMNARGYRAEALHGGMSQDQRDRAMGRLKSGVATLLIATDVAARGIDVDHLSHVVNYDIPQTTEAYTHRIGRVGRAGREGIAITLGGPKDHRKINNIARYTKQNIAIEKVPTVNDLTMRRVQTTGAEVAAKIGETESADLYRTIVEQLTADHDPVDVAIAAVRLAHEAAGRTSKEEEIPDVNVRSEQGGRDRYERDDRKGHRGQRDDRGGRGDRNDRGRGGNENRAVRNADGTHHVEAGFVSLQFNLGRSAGLRPGDLVGAIANEANMRGSEIGAIKINDKSAFVQVPEKHAGKVLRSMDGTKIRNKPVRVRRANN
ncbi:DEAD/DEAH box helicase [Ilumatobacter sp.]|uniref:DEAD/DEAH box helicase n=1 Tax=Ilumatobacter sp. TaxID=1967498 RepID=UPI003C3E3FB2